MQRADGGQYRVTVQPKWQHNLGPILAQFLHHWSLVRIWGLFWFILWLKYLRFSEARSGSPLVEPFKALAILVYFGPGLAENYGPIYLLARALILVQEAKVKKFWAQEKCKECTRKEGVISTFISLPPSIPSHFSCTKTHFPFSLKCLPHRLSDVIQSVYPFTLFNIYQAICIFWWL